MLLQKDFKCTERTRRLVTGTVFYAYEITHVSDGHQAILTYFPPRSIIHIIDTVEFRQQRALWHFYCIDYLLALPSGAASPPVSGAKADIDEWDLIRAASSGTLPAPGPTPRILSDVDESAPAAECIASTWSREYYGGLEEKTFPTCQHEYKAYQGFNESYDYCIKCDHKKVGV